MSTEQDQQALVEKLRFALRDWNGTDRFHFPNVNALVLNEAVEALSRATPSADEIIATLDRQKIAAETKRRMMKDATGGFYDEWLFRVVAEHAVLAAKALLALRVKGLEAEVTKKDEDLGVCEGKGGK